ncbi:hypothetical protein BAUCODRAFT_23427 [Baudoinia panamericana UAMH 10762]|uniref:RFX-type winged-helix domain-containing protein n=1 Tax=Baudoinia panamericana (strain UAMH 10762) TaxID=717646 RepID=M2NCW2_BAUPA|nr:uncharacterized protein BAUCODRAFT_23427 [Baudoinia panamericana UAMH 10762]EMC97029.1 hypothetical protein BAUCODRAFT_23427 [Baudoinia panamericana UAMH 10762]
MAAGHRANASTSAHSRPLSRASTTSATSLRNEESELFLSQPTQVHPTPEAQLLQYHASTQPQSHDLYQQQQQQQQQQHAHHQYVHNTQYAMPPGMHTQELPLMPQESDYANHQRMGSVPIQSGTEMADGGRRKGSAVTATNDKELRELLSRNEGRPLREVAQEVNQKERTPMAEKTKQLFAMLWLRAVCKPAKTSVPRNRVYSQYASRCGTERVVPLNPASFGKLVRVIFPGIQTRRLGVRGESKYHYVDLGLDDESLNPITNPDFAQYNQIQSRSRRSESVSTQHYTFNGGPPLQADTSAFPATDSTNDLHPPPSALPRGPSSQSRVFAYPDSRGMAPSTAESITYPQTLRFPSSTLPTFSETESVNLPPIQPYLPPRTDPDTAESLYALYRTHTTSLIDSIRFCKEKQFFRLYTSFHGTLTVPVQKLFVHPSLSPWIEACDLVMYRTMVRFVSRLTLQAAPVVVINILSNISATLHGHIAKTFASQPGHVLDAKLRPATVFASLLYRLIRVNQSAHAAANLLTIDQNREQMWREWVTMVNPKRVIEAELPPDVCGYEEVYKILTTEMRSLLEPLAAPPMFNHQQEDPYGFTASTAAAYNFNEDSSFAAYLQSQTLQPPPGSSSTSNDISAPGSASGVSMSTENVLDRWSTFIGSLPSRFPNASARVLLGCVSAVGTAALRDITICGGQSYGHWWVLKIFVDEMALWLGEMGGFLESTSVGVVSDGVGMMGNGTGAGVTVTMQGFRQSPLIAQGLAAGAGSRRGSVAPDGGSVGLSMAETNGYHTHTAPQHQQQQLPYMAPHRGQQQQQHQQHQQQQHQQQHYQPEQHVAMNEHFSFQQAPSLQHQHQHQHQHQQQQQQQQHNGELSFHLSTSSIQDPHAHSHHQHQHQHQHSQQHLTAGAGDIDDSGIGMSLLDDDLTMAKLGVTGPHVGVGGMGGMVRGDLRVETL